MYGLIHDLQFSLRSLSRRPISSLVIVFTLALGIGMNTMFFGSFYGMVLRPLPFVDADRLVAVHEAMPRLNRLQMAVSTGVFLDWRDHQTVFSDLGAYRYQGFNLYSDDLPERVDGAAITWDLFPLLGVAPQLGRLMNQQESQDQAAVAVVSHALWQRSLGGDPSVIGRKIELNGNKTEIVGVMPAGFAFPNSQEIWTPLSIDRADARRTGGELMVIGRLGDGVSLPQARVSMKDLAGEQRALYPELEEGWTIEAQELRAAWMPPVTHIAAFSMQVMVLLVLLVVCANVANMVLIRANERGREMAVRAALGAGRGNLVRLALVESLLLALLGGAAGLIPASLYDSWIREMVSIPIPYWLSFGLETPVLLFTVALIVLVAVVIGLWPALKSSAAAHTGKVRLGVRSASQGTRMQRLLVVSEYAMAVLILFSALLMVGSYRHLEAKNPGFSVDRVMTLQLSLSGWEFDDPVRGLGFFDRALEQIRSLPDVHSAALVNHLPISRDGYRASRFTVDGAVVESGAEPRVTIQAVSGKYFDTLGITLEQGRDFSESELAEGRPVAVISQSLAGRLWPSQDPLHRRIRLLDDGLSAGGESNDGTWADGTGADGTWVDVIGMAADVEAGEALAGIDPQPSDQIYLPLTFHPSASQAASVTGSSTGPNPATTWSWIGRHPSLVVASSEDPQRLGPRLRRELAAIDTRVAVHNPRPMSEILEQFYFAQHIWSRMFSLLALVALIIASVGAYGVSSYSVSRRAQEMGIRLALGAAPETLFQQVVGQGMRLAIVGLAIGLGLALPMSFAMAILVHGAGGGQPWLYLGVAGVLTAVAILATVVPARRASRIQPASALRAD